MDCRSFRKHHLAYVDDTLTERERDAMRIHASACAECSRQDTAVRRALMVARSVSSIAPSVGFTARLEQRLREARNADYSSWAQSRRASRGPGIGEFLAAAAGVVAAGFLLTAVIERISPRPLPVLAAAMASAPETDAPPIAAPAFVASASPIVSVWPAALMLDQAHLHFATTELAADRGR
jgi:hypothetical protein